MNDVLDPIVSALAASAIGPLPLPAVLAGTMTCIPAASPRLEGPGDDDDDDDPGKGGGNGGGIDPDPDDGDGDDDDDDDDDDDEDDTM